MKLLFFRSEFNVYKLYRWWRKRLVRTLVLVQLIFWSTKFIQKIFQILRHPKNSRDFLIYPKQSQKPTAINHCFNCYHGRMALILELWDRDLRHLFPASCFACAWRIRWVGWWCHYFKELRWWKFHFPGMTWTFLPRLLFNYKINLFNAADYDLDEHEKLLRENLRHTVPGTEVIPRKNSWVNFLNLESGAEKLQSPIFLFKTCFAKSMDYRKADLFLNSKQHVAKTQNGIFKGCALTKITLINLRKISNASFPITFFRRWRSSRTFLQQMYIFGMMQHVWKVYKNWT